MNPTVIISYFATAAAFIVGLLLLIGVVGEGLEPNLRIIFGIVFAAYAVYRFLYVQSKVKEAKRREIHEKMRIEKEKLFTNEKDD